MITILDIFRKDSRRHWLLLAAWLGTLGLGVLSVIVYPFAQEGPAQAILTIFDLPHWILFGVIVIAFFHEDRFAGVREFWMTRPIPPLHLLAAKVLSLFLWLAIPSGLAAVASVRALGGEFSFALKIGVNASALAVFLLLTLAVVAAITDNFFRCVVVAVVAWLSLALGALFAQTSRSFSFYAPMSWHNQVATYYAAGLGLGLGSLGLLAYQVRTRKTKVTVGVGIVVFAGIWNAAIVFPALDRIGGTSIRTTPPEQIEISGVRLLPPKPGAMAPSILAGFDFGPAPEGRHFEISESSSDFETAESIHRWRHRAGNEFYYSQEGDDPNQSQLVLAIPNATDYSAVSKKQGTLTGHWIVNERELRIIEVPLKQDEVVRGRGLALRFNRLHANLDAQHAAMVEFNVTLVNWWRRRFRLSLVNRFTHEKTVPHYLNGWDEPFAQIERQPRFYLALVAAAPAPGDPNVTKTDRRMFPVEWLKDADLVITEENWIGSVEKTVVAKDVTIPW